MCRAKVNFLKNLPGEIESDDLAALGRWLDQSFPDGVRTLEGAALMDGSARHISDWSTAFPDGQLQMLQRAGLFRPCDRGARGMAPMALRRIGGVWIVTDHARNKPWPDDLIDPLWESANLVRLLVGAPPRRALDMGCGSGIFALHLAQRHSDVVASDLNDRALAWGRFNAALNGLPNIRFVHSDLFGALQGEVFDRIVFNAPSGGEFRGQTLMNSGEQILSRFFHDMPSHLNPEGGVAELNATGQDWTGKPFMARILDWMGPAAGPVQRSYLEQWRIDGGAGFWRGRLKESLRSGRNYFHCRAIQRGWLTLRRANGGASRRVVTNYHDWIPQHPEGAGPALIETLMTAPSAHPLGGERLPPLLAGLLATAKDM
jgi:SAM-dependent methyltransferase